MTASAFAKRFALTRFETGGVIVDLQNGNYFQLNPSAALVCEALRDAPDAVASRERIARELRLTGEEADRLIRELLADLAVAPQRGTPQGAYRYLPDPLGYALWDGSRCVLRVDGEALSVARTEATPTDRAEALEAYLRAVAVKLLFIRGVTVFHASTCRIGGRLVAFAGASGAGKTTTARAFRDAGATLVSEDLVVLQPDGAPGDVVSDGERVVRAWARQASAELVARHARPVPSDGLQRALVGEPEPLAEMLFLDADRRAGTRIVRRQLEGAEALLALMTNDFLGGSDPEGWRRYLEAARAASTSVSLFAAQMPAGLDALAEAARAYISS